MNVLNCWFRDYLNFNGKTDRRTFCIFILISLILSVLFFILKTVLLFLSATSSHSLGGGDTGLVVNYLLLPDIFLPTYKSQAYISLVYLFVLNIPIITASYRRLHDAGFIGALVFIPLCIIITISLILQGRISPLLIADGYILGFIKTTISLLDGLSVSNVLILISYIFIFTLLLKPTKHV